MITITVSEAGYVRGPDGQSAVWSFSLEAARLPAVLAARTTYWLRYFWADMRVDQDGRRVRYQSRRRLDRPAPFSSGDVGGSARGIPAGR